MKRITGSLALALLMGGALLAPVSPTRAAPSAIVVPAPLVTIGAYDEYFSPNGDGVADRARFRFELDKPSAVLVKIYRQRDVVRRVRLGMLPAGTHTWRWNGKAGGEVLPDGPYFVSIRATSGRRSETVGVGTRVRSNPDAGRLVLSRTTLYPAATVVRDRLAVAYVRADYEVIEDKYPEYFEDTLRLRTRLEIRAPDGDRVLVASRDTYRPVFSWAARDAKGEPLPPGAYRLKLTVADPLGNVRTIRRTIQVSAGQLTQQVWSSTIGAADAASGPWPLYDPSCLGCGDVCGPTPSERFPDGLSFPEPCPESWAYAAVKFFGAAPPVPPAPADSYRISATGGPPVPGGNGSGWLGPVEMGPGDVTVTTPWRRANLTDYPYLPDGEQPVNWGFGTEDGTGDYDVASFTVEYRYYVPVG